MKKILVGLSLLLSVAVGKTVFDDYDNAFKIAKSVLPKDVTCEDKGKGKRKGCTFENGSLSIRDKQVVLSYIKTTDKEALDVTLLPLWKENCANLAKLLGADEYDSDSLSEQVKQMIDGNIKFPSMHPLYSNTGETELVVKAAQSQGKNNHSAVLVECRFKEQYKDHVSDDGWQKIN